MRLSMYGPAKTNCLRFVCTLRPGVRASSRRGAEGPRTEGSDCYARDAVMLGMPLCSAYSAPFHGPARAQRRRELSHCAARRRKAPPRCLPAICAAGRTEGAGSGERPAPAVHRRRRLPAGDSVPALRSRLCAHDGSVLRDSVPAVRSRLYAPDGSVLRDSVPAVRSPATLCRLCALRRLCAGCALPLGVGSRAPSAPAMPTVRHPCPLRVALGLYWWRDVEGWRRICTEKESRVTEGQGMRIAL